VDDYRERIQISSKGNRTQLIEPLQKIPIQDLIKTHEYLLSRVPEALKLTYYEWTILLALQYFSDQKVDFAVLETGLGGRWDATNICESILSGITTIGYDHTEYLGDTLEKILVEKLQIINSNSDFLFGPRDPELEKIAREHCSSMNARFHRMKDFRFWISDLRLQKFNDIPGYLKDNLMFTLSLGKILEERGYAVKFEEFLSSHIPLPPARMEIVHKNPTILVDGAHNEEGLYALKEYLKAHHQDNYDLIFGSLANRPFLKLAKIIQSPHKNYWARFDGDHRTTPEAVYQQVKENFGGEIIDLDGGFKKKLLQQKSNKTIVVCGSFYLCSEFKRLFRRKPKDQVESCF